MSVPRHMKTQGLLNKGHWNIWGGTGRDGVPKINFLEENGIDYCQYLFITDIFGCKHC